VEERCEEVMRMVRKSVVVGEVECYDPLHSVTTPARHADVAQDYALFCAVNNNRVI